MREDGTRVRVNVELVAAQSGQVIWSEQYDRELTDVVAIQDDIARAIVTSLQIRLARVPAVRRPLTRNL